MRLFQLIPFFVFSMMLLAPLTISDSAAHAPTDIVLGSITTDQITITWTHAGSSSAAQQKDVDILRQVGSTGWVNILNNSTLAGSYVDTSLAAGTEYSYTVCHGEGSGSDSSGTGYAAAILCPDSIRTNTNGTQAGIGPKVYAVTLPCAPGFEQQSVSTDGCTASDTTYVPTFNLKPTEIDVFWAGHQYNNTQVAGLKVEYASVNSAGTVSSFTTATTNSTNAMCCPNNSTAQKWYTITGLSADTNYQVRLSTITTTTTENIAGTAGNNTGGTSATSLWDAGITVPAQSAIKTQVGPGASYYATGDADANLKVTLKENSGWDRILNVALYTNISAGEGIGASDTSITWNFFDGVSVTDPNNYFNDVNVVAEQSGVRTQDFTYEITWNKPLGANDVIIETKDFQSNAGLTVINEAWTSFPVTQVSYEIPEETSEETIMTLFDGGVMNHLLLNNDVSYVENLQYFVEDAIIDVSQDDKVVVQSEDNVINQLFDKFTLSNDKIKVGHKYFETLVISGTIKGEFYQYGIPVTFSITNPDGSETKISAVTTSDRTFEVPMILDKSKTGLYQFTPSHGELLGELFSYRQ